MKCKSDLTPEYIDYLLHYNPDTGVFTWRVRRGNKLPGSRAGAYEMGYQRIRVGRKHYRAARLAFVIMEGEWPSEWIDHMDRNPGNDRWNNLRPATPSQNARNRSPRKGVSLEYPTGDIYFRKDRGTWRVRARVDGKRVSVGCFKTKEEAKAACVP